jgi:hypothetical protein
MNNMCIAILQPLPPWRLCWEGEAGQVLTGTMIKCIYMHAYLTTWLALYESWPETREQVTFVPLWLQISVRGYVSTPGRRVEYLCECLSVHVASWLDVVWRHMLRSPRP